MSVAPFLTLTNRLAEVEANLRQADSNVNLYFDRWTRASQGRDELIKDRAAILRAIARERAILEQKGQDQ